VSGLTLKPLGRFSPVWPQSWWVGFLGLKLKTDSCCLVIWSSKSPRRFLGLDLKIKHASVYQLRHKTDGGWTAWGTRRGLATCFTWKQVMLGFFSLASRLAEARRRVMHVAPSRRLRRDQVEDGWIDATGYIGPCYPYFTVFYVSRRMNVVVI
jgi:hypothetical protein